MKYTIKRGHHYHSSLLMRIYQWIALRINRKDVAYKVRITPEAWYNESEVENLGYNKLFGGGALNHHETSARFVWLPDFDNVGKYKIFSYVYRNGMWKSNYLFTMTANQTYNMRVSVISTGYVFKWDGFYDFVDHDDPKLTKLLQPYHGGKDTAYHTYTIYLT